jgi:hypothetical protein
MEIREGALRRVREMILGVSAKRSHWLSRAGILPDHVHLVLGCRVDESPQEAALSYMNNLAFALGMKRAFMFGFYVGTVGEYDLGVIPSCQSALHRGKPGGGGSRRR